MAKNSKGNLIGSWAFLIGVIIALVLGAFGNVQGGVLTTLVVIGVIVGLLNIADEEAAPFLMSGVVLIIAGEFGGNALGQLPFASGVLAALSAIFVPATIIVAIKNVFGLARH